MSLFLPDSLSHRVYVELAYHSPYAAQRFQTIFSQTMFSLTADKELTLINRFWRLQLARLPVPTYDERECLCDEADFELWLVNFKKHVIPTILQHDLPQPEV